MLVWQVHRDDPLAKRADDAGKQLPATRKGKARGVGQTVDEVGVGNDVPPTTRAFPAGLQLAAPAQRRGPSRRSPPADPQAAAPAQDAVIAPPKVAETIKEASSNPQPPALLSSEPAPSAQPPRAVSPSAEQDPAPLAPVVADAVPPAVPAAKGGSRGQGLLLAAQAAQQKAGALAPGAKGEGAGGASSAVDDALDFLAIEGIRKESAVERAKANTRTLARRIPQRAPLAPRAPPVIPHHREAPPGLLAPPLRHPASWGGEGAAAAAGGLQAGVMSRKVPEYSDVELVALLPVRYARCSPKPPAPSFRPCAMESGYARSASSA